MSEGPTQPTEASGEDNVASRPSSNEEKETGEKANMEESEEDGENEEEEEGEEDNEGEEYFKIREGQYSELIGDTPKRIIAVGYGFIVYLNKENRARVSAEDFPDGYGEIANLVVDLEAAPTIHLKDEQIVALRSFGGHALVRCVDEKDLSTARMAVESGWRYYRERSAEVSRRWYLVASLWSFLVIALFVFIGCAKTQYVETYGVNAALLYFSFFAGGAGAFISIVFRLGSVCPDPSGGRGLHTYESVARILVGCLTGVMFSVAILGGVALNVLSAVDRQDGSLAFYFCIFVAMTTGASERAVPDLVTSSKLGASVGRGPGA